MKKALIIAATMIALTVAAQSNEIVFQKTYEVPGMNEKEIIQAFGTTQMEKEATTLNQISTALTFIGQPLSASSQPFKKKDVSQITCNIAATSWLPAVDGHYNAEVIVQAKDGRYRVTVSNMIDSGNSGIILLFVYFLTISNLFHINGSEFTRSFLSSKYGQSNKRFFLSVNN